MVKTSVAEGTDISANWQSVDNLRITADHRAVLILFSSNSASAPEIKLYPRGRLTIRVPTWR